VVVRDVLPGVVVAGVPAEVIKSVSDIVDRDKIRILDKLRGRRT